MQYGKAMTAILGLVPTCASHMIMKTPTPYGAGSINNSPLVADGSDYPCKQRPGVYEKGSASNTMAVGSPQTLSFTGSATHGGGSCQISLTKDLKPTKDTDFRVILSIEGGCPASSAGNLGEDPNGSGASTFQYSIPKDVAPGDYTLAWTWFNKIGNREMYMNCAPITVTGSKKRDVFNETESNDNLLEKRDLNSLPAMFKANIGSESGDCHTADSTDLAFPDPGGIVQKHGSSALTPPTGNCKAAAGAASGSAGAGAGGSQAGNAQAGSPSASPSASAVPSAAKSGAIPTHTILATAVPTASAAVPSASANSTGAGSGGSDSTSSGSTDGGAASGGTGSSSSSGSGSTAGSGSMTCSADGKQFQLPGGPMQAVAAGTKCQNGQIMYASAKKRSAKFGRAIPGWA